MSWNCFCSSPYSPQGMGYIQFNELAHSKLRQLVIEQKGKKVYNVSFHIWCQNCKWRLKDDPYITYRTYKLIKRHSFHYKDHCVHCDPQGDIIV